MELPDSQETDNEPGFVDDDNEPDFLDELIAERTKRNPDFPRLVEEATRRRERLRDQAATRQSTVVREHDAA